MLFLRKWTDPSPKAKLAPPGCKLMNPLADAPKRQPTGAEADCQVELLQAPPATGRMVLELNPSGTVVPAYDPLNIQKLLSAALLGNTSPTMIVLLVPSVTLAILGVAGCRGNRRSRASFPAPFTNPVVPPNEVPQ